MNFDDFVRHITSSTDRPSKVVEFPTPTGIAPFHVRLWVLSDEETRRAVLDAEAWVNEQLKDKTVSDESARILLDAEEDRQILCRALRDHSDASSPLTTVDQLRRALNKDMRAVLMQHYLAWCDESSPFKSLGALPLEQKVAALRNFHEAGALSDYLSSCDFDTQRNIALLLADLLFKPQTQSS